MGDSAPAKQEHLFGALLGIAPKVAAGIGMAVYAAGFITVNAHLSKFGYQDYALADPQFFLVGAVVVVFFTCWYLFSGRAVIHMKSWMNGQIQTLQSDKTFNTFWGLLAFVLSFVDVGFMTALSTSTFAAFAFLSPALFGFSAALTVGFVVLYPLEILRLHRTFLAGSLIFKCGALVAFAAVSTLDFRLSSLFSFFLLMSFYVNLVADSFERKGTSRERVVFATVYSAFSVLLVVFLFGRYFYGDISQRVGGGELVSASLVLSGPTVVAGAETDRLAGEILHQSRDDVVILLSGTVLVLNRSAIRSIELQPPPPERPLTMLESLAKVLRVFGFRLPDVLPRSDHAAASGPGA